MGHEILTDFSAMFPVCFFEKWGFKVCDEFNGQHR